MQRPQDTFLVVGFLSLLALPGLGLFAFPATAVLPSAPQKEYPAGTPLSNAPAAFEGYFDTHLGFRSLLVRVHHFTSYALLGTAPNKDVIVGSDGWVFLAQDNNLSSFLGDKPFSQAQLDAWTKALESCQSWIGKWGGRLLFVVTPNKETIYAERVPPHLRAQRAARTRLDQLVAHLSKTSVPFVDLRSSLWDAKREHQIYAKLDTHWNGHGAVVAASQILDKLYALNGRPPPLDRKRVVMERDDGPGDMARFMALEGWARETRPRAVLDQPRARRLAPKPELPELDLELEWKNRVVHETPDASLPKAVIFRDSFAMALRPLLVDSFSRSVWVWQREFAPDVLAAEQPEIVIFQTAERYLEGEPIANACGG